MKKIFTKEVTIGVTVLITLLILFFGIDYLKGINIFHPANYYYVTYNNVAGLTESAPVTVNGYKVGLVREIAYEYDNPGHVRVEISLDKSLKVPRGSKAVLVTSLLGTAEIDLRMASGQSHHEIGDVLIGENAAGLMDGLSGDVMPSISRMIPHIDSLLITVTDLAADPALASSISRLERVMANLESSTALLEKALGPTPAITSSAATAMTDVREVASNLAAISSSLNEVSKTLKVMPLDSTVNNIHRMSANLLALSEQLNTPDSSLGMLMRDPSLYNNLNGTMSRIDTLLMNINNDPKKYMPKIKLF